MTKKEIYEKVVRLTSEIAETKIAQRIFDAAMDGNAEKTDMLISAFPYYYPELYKRIVSFGDEFNKLVGNSKEEEEKLDKIISQSKIFMNCLMRTRIISQIAEAADAEDTAKLQEVITNFKLKFQGLVQNLVELQKKFDEFRYNSPTGNEGKIFGAKADEENGVFVFDTNTIDALSFYVLLILAEVDDIYFFHDEEVEEDGNVFTVLVNDDFVDAIEKATNEAFATFVSSYSIADWVGENEEHHSVGELLVDVLADNFEEEEP